MKLFSVPLDASFVKDTGGWVIVVVLVKTRTLLWLYALSGVDRFGDETFWTDTARNACFIVTLAFTIPHGLTRGT